MEFEFWVGVVTGNDANTKQTGEVEGRGGLEVIVIVRSYWYEEASAAT